MHQFHSPGFCDSLRGGTHTGTVLLHQICHSAIHARFTETELARERSDPDALRAHPAMAEFIAWVANRPPDFHARTRIKGGGRRKRP